MDSVLRLLRVSEPGILHGSELAPQHSDLEAALPEPRLLVFQACLLLSLALLLPFLALIYVAQLLLEALHGLGQQRDLLVLSYRADGFLFDKHFILLFLSSELP